MDFGTTTTNQSCKVLRILKLARFACRLLHRHILAPPHIYLTILVISRLCFNGPGSSRSHSSLTSFNEPFVMVNRT